MRIILKWLLEYSRGKIAFGSIRHNAAVLQTLYYHNTSAVNLRWKIVNKLNPYSMFGPMPRLRYKPPSKSLLEDANAVQHNTPIIQETSVHQGEISMKCRLHNRCRIMVR